MTKMHEINWMAQLRASAAGSASGGLFSYISGERRTT